MGAQHINEVTLAQHINEVTLAQHSNWTEWYMKPTFARFTWIYWGGVSKTIR